MAKPSSAESIAVFSWRFGSYDWRGKLMECGGHFSMISPERGGQIYVSALDGMVCDVGLS